MPAPDDLAWGPPWWRGDARSWQGPPPGARYVLAAVVALIQVAGSFGAAQGQPERRGPDALAVLLLLVGPAALTMLRRRPREALVVVAAATTAFLAIGYPYGPVFLSLAIAIVATVAQGHRVTAWVVGGAMVLVHSVARLVADSPPWSWVVLGGEVAWLLVLLSVGELFRVRGERAATFRQAAMERRRREAGEERLRIAQELHDVVAHHMSLINVQAGVALHLSQRKPENVEPALRAIRDASKEALTELRSLVEVLRDPDSPAPRSPAATLSALDDMVDRAAHAGLSVHKVVAGEAHPLPAAVELAATRIAQEAVTNVVRHAHATRAEVRLDYGDGVLEVRIDDDGRGADDALKVLDSLQGNGIRGMRERASALGGTLDVAPSPLGGVRVRATLPTRGRGRP